MWTVRHSPIEGVLNNYKALVSCLHEVQEGRDEYAAKARGLLTQMESFELLFSLKLSYVVFAAAEQLSINLQAKDIIHSRRRNERCTLALITSVFVEIRCKVYEDILRSSQELTNELVLPRYRKMPRRLEGGVEPYRFVSPKNRYRHAYFEALEQACGEIDRQFDQSDISVVVEIESFLINQFS